MWVKSVLHTSLPLINFMSHRSNWGIFRRHWLCWDCELRRARGRDNTCTQLALMRCSPGSLTIYPHQFVRSARKEWGWEDRHSPSSEQSGSKFSCCGSIWGNCSLLVEPERPRTATTQSADPCLYFVNKDNVRWWPLHVVGGALICKIPRWRCG